MHVSAYLIALLAAAALAVWAYRAGTSNAVEGYESKNDILAGKILRTRISNAVAQAHLAVTGRPPAPDALERLVSKASDKVNWEGGASKAALDAAAKAAVLEVI